MGGWQRLDRLGGWWEGVPAAAAKTADERATAVMRVVKRILNVEMCSVWSERKEASV